MDTNKAAPWILCAVLALALGYYGGHLMQRIIVSGGETVTVVLAP